MQPTARDDGGTPKTVPTLERLYRSRENPPGNRPWYLLYRSSFSLGVEHVSCESRDDGETNTKVDEVIFGFLFHRLE